MKIPPKAKSPHGATVIRVVKLNKNKLGASLAHTYRTMPVPHADSSRTHLNQDWRPASSPKEVQAEVRKRLELADNVTDNSVRVIEYIVSAPHEAFSEQGGPVEWEKYFRDALAYLENRHGADNIVGVNVQLDEQTPHLVVYVVPLVRYPATTRKREVIVGKRDGEIVRGVRAFPVPSRTALSATYYMGKRYQLRELQTTFAEEVAIPNGLRRGLHNSAATHVTTRQYHQALLRKMASNLDLTSKDLEFQGMLWSKESPDEHAARITSLVVDHYAPIVESAAKADIEKKRANEMAETARRTEAALEREIEAHRRIREKYSSLVAGLTDDEVKGIREFSRDRLRERQKEEEAKKRENAKRQEVERVERKKEENEKATKLQHIPAETLARLDNHQRIQLWRLAMVRDDLEKTLTRWMESGLFNGDGTLSNRGKTLVEKSAPELHTSHPRRGVSPAIHPKGKRPPSSFER